MAEPPRFLTRDARSTLVPHGLRRHFYDDLYFLVLTTPWWRFLAGIVALYVGINLLFAMAYAEVGGIENLPAGSFVESFFFSVQTIATIGYGKMAPVSLAANLLVTVESVLGLLGFALATGLMFAKFSRPTARVLWSNVAVVTRWDGVPSLLFRMANQRGNQIVEAQLRLSVLLSERTAEGQSVRRVHDLKLARGQSAFFALTWTAIHPLTGDSPLATRSPEELRASRAEIVASLTGLDETVMQTIHSRYAYSMDDIVWNARFVDVFGTLPNGRPEVDFAKFHDVVPEEEPLRAGSEGALGASSRK